MSRFYRNRSSSTMIAALLLLLLVILAGQNTFSGFISNLFSSYFNVRPACSNLRPAFDRHQHQSLIARAAADRGAPVRVDLLIGRYPVTANESLQITLVLTNLTVGTVPFVYSGGIPFNNPAPDGFGVVAGTQPLPPITPSNGFLPESNVRLLVPLQSCTETLVLSVGQLQQFGIQPGTALRAYYRNSNRGALVNSGGAVYPDQGLWVGSTESRSISVPIEAAAQ